MEISRDLREEMEEHDINPDDVTAVTSRYDKGFKILITTVTVSDGTMYTMHGKPVWYAPRKGKKW